MGENKQLITIKGTRDGLTLFIDDSSSFGDCLRELQTIILTSQPKKTDPIVAVTVQLGHRYLHDHQKVQLEEIIGAENRLSIQAFESDVVLKADALKWKEESEVKVFKQIVRSGQLLEVEGDLLLVGDVNPGGRVVSTGNIYVMGKLRGIAHAGVSGDQNAVIAAAYMKPSQLRIAGYISRAPDYETTGVYMECGYFDHTHEKIMIDSLSVITKMRQDLSGFERRMQNG